MSAERIRFPQLPSTMEVAHDAAARGAAHGTVVVADVQTAGRGTRGRDWSSGAGGLWLSVVARPRRADALEALSLRIGLALAQVLEQQVAALPALGVKWPNDIVIGPRKVAGILCEARWAADRCQWVVIGAGINVQNRIPASLATIAAAVGEFDPGITAARLLDPVAAAIALASSEAGPLGDGELREFALRDALLNIRVGHPVEGTALGITRHGALRVRTDQGMTRDVLAGVVAVAR
jgi:BirA family biotin operon repressor/biotin-[acetyl-CoA-carboxylase] ligase